MKLSLIHENSAQGYDRSQSSPEAIARRSTRNKARRKLEKAGRCKPGDGKHVHHSRPLSRGGGNGDKNLKVVEPTGNWAEGAKISSQNKKRKH